MQVGVQWTGQYYAGQPQVPYVHTLAAQSEYTRQYAWQSMGRWYARQKCSFILPRVNNLRPGLTLVLMLLFLHPCCVRRTIIFSLFPYNGVHVPTIFLCVFVYDHCLLKTG